MKRWETKVVYWESCNVERRLDETANELTKEGWQLINVTETRYVVRGAIGEIVESKYTMFFTREIAE